ncbi:PROTEIN KINASE SUPERFAMILY PROTEIN [Salix koriyanagi]|uniref:PROTEIN KINASE SUPERFAMILY PROTEIN n=1 Tax=Salix koriyanagi TaxID=2511006 RepID=A0A9Q0UFH4_9ROSI|nr:PROTEIN KINASE SUPERFAMILY PROTEIN [Salix koriyanagi]
MRLFSCFRLKKKSSFKWIIANDFGHVINVADKSKRRNLSQVFTFHELAVATENFNPQCLVGEGGFGKVYKGYIESIDQIVAVKQLDRNGLQGNREFFCEVLTLSLVQHSNLVKLIGYCADGNQRLLVYEFMASGSLENHLLAPLFKDRSQFTAIADPLLGGKYPKKSLYQALAIAAMCIQEEADRRPLIADVVMALEYLAMPTDEKKSQFYEES